MICLRNAAPRFLAIVVLIGSGITPLRASMTDLDHWSLVQDPANPHLTASTNSTTATLVATGGPIPTATDIGFASINGPTPALSTSGFAFDPGSSFSLAIDYDLSFSNSPTGGLAIGFGIGEDTGGMNSAGAVLFTNNGSATGLGAAARINDVTQTPQVLGIGGTLTGSLFASYDASTGDVTLGYSATPGASSASASKTFSGIEHSWNGGLLLASFFLRSDASLGSSWQSGDARAVFSDFRILRGSAVAVPEPGSLALVAIGLAVIMGRRFKVLRGPSTRRS